MIKHNTISFRLSIIFIALIISLSIFFMGYNYVKASQSSHNYLVNITDQITDTIIDRTRFHLNKTNTHIKTLTNNNSTESILDNEYTNFQIMKEFVLSEEHLASVYLADNYGNFLQVRRDPDLATRKIDNQNFARKEFWEYKDNNFNTTSKTSYKGEYEPRNRFWFQDASKDKIKISNPYIYASTGKLGITIFYPKFNKKDKKLIVSGIDITLDSLTKFLKYEAKKFYCDIVLIDDQKRVISSNIDFTKGGLKTIQEFEESHVILKASQEYLKGKNLGKVQNQNQKNYHYMGRSFLIDNKRTWHLVLSIPEALILKDAKKTLNETIIISIFILVIFIIISILVSRQITKPIVTLSKNMDELHKLNLDIDIKIDSKIKEIKEAQESLSTLKHGFKSFAKYMPYDLVRKIVLNNKEAQIGGSERDIAIMFTDIEGFTSISEKLTPRQLTLELTKYFTFITSIVKRYEGTIDKFIGDSVMAFWNAPLKIDEPIKKSVLTALKIQKELDELNRVNKEKNRPIFKTRIGIHYGKTLVGNIGSQKRMNYTIIGDNVNIAAKLERKNKKYKTSILISQAVYEKVKDDFEIEFIDTVNIKGKSVPIKIYTVHGIKQKA